jgi:primosomal protein N' (replication factor Y)
MMNCDYCDTTMVYHKDLALPLGGYLQCHHCTAEQILPKTCPQCAKKVTVFGLGTQRVEEEISKKFPQARLLRMDSDVMRTAHDYHTGLERFRKHEVDILVGTQMIAKGLDFPNVRLVGVISADTAINMPDFRASERTFQLIAQVAGRAGRDIDGGEPSLVLVQTFNPQDAAIVSASQHDYPGFAARELELRKAVGLPPVTRMARIVIRDRDLANCTTEARRLAQQLTTHRDAMQLAVKIRGPAPCPIGRIAEFYRQQVELIAPEAGIIQRLLTALRNEKMLVSDAQMAVDVDPVSLL